MNSLNNMFKRQITDQENQMLQAVLKEDEILGALRQISSHARNSYCLEFVGTA